MCETMQIAVNSVINWSFFYYTHNMHVCKAILQVVQQLPLEHWLQLDGRVYVKFKTAQIMLLWCQTTDTRRNTEAVMDIRQV